MAQFRKDSHTYLPQETTIFEVVMLADQYGNLVGPANPSGTSVDAFGRARISQPITLFDSFHRYRENKKFNTANSATNSSYTFDANASHISMNVGTANSAYVFRETTKVFAYQPGKSLLVMNTFVMGTPQNGLRQRAGYFSTENGVYLEQGGVTGTDITFVIRSNSSGTVTEERALQSTWNVDKLDGTGPSLKTLDLTKAQIFWTDIEWLGVGSVRCGFVIDGQFIHCHSFHHANKTSLTYMTTACLPVRTEIENVRATGNNSVMNVICTSVISEAGYELRGSQWTIGQNPNTSYTLTTASTYYPVVALRLRAENPDAIVIPKNISVLGLGGNGSRIGWKLVSGATVTGGSWVNADTANSSIQYNITGTAMSGGQSWVSGYAAVSQQSTATIDLGNVAEVFRHQFERNSFANSNVSVVLAVAGYGNGDTAIGSIDWEEIT